MTKEVFENHALPAPGTDWPKDRLIYEISIQKPVVDRLIFQKKKIESGEKANLSGHLRTDFLDVVVTEDCIIEFRLSTDMKWFWNEERGVGRGDEKVEQYFDPLYWDETKSKWVTPTPGSKYARMQFSARFRGVTDPVSDHMNLNILLEYPDGKVLPITIDPEIQNPKA